jgi:hypothetical protein
MSGACTIHQHSAECAVLALQPMMKMRRLPAITGTLVMLAGVVSEEN